MERGEKRAPAKNLATAGLAWVTETGVAPRGRLQKWLVAKATVGFCESLQDTRGLIAV